MLLGSFLDMNANVKFTGIGLRQDQLRTKAVASWELLFKALESSWLQLSADDENK